SHDGDAGGDPPGDRRTRMLPHQYEGSGKRREIKHKGRVPLPSGLDPTWLCGLATPSGLGAL
ncbi:hypothetical protein Tco_0515647, partial [Tanacetum coccineum]